MSRQTYPPHWTALQRAAWATVHEYRTEADDDGHKGAMALAPLLERNPRSLSNEVNPDAESHKLGLDEAAAIQRITRDYRILHAMAQELGFVVIPGGNLSGVSDAELVETILKWQVDCGQTAEAIQMALSGEKIHPAEIREVERELYEDLAAGAEIVRRLRALVNGGAREATR